MVAKEGVIARGGVLGEKPAIFRLFPEVGLLTACGMSDSL
jgi:hypothetical protein